MAYLVSLLMVAAALTLLLAMLVARARQVRRLASATRLVRASAADRTGLLRARFAALKLDLTRRFRAIIKPGGKRPPALRR